MKRWLPISVGVALALLVAWTAHQRWLVLTESPFPVGIDGYFYPIQLRALLERHELAYPDFPLAFLLMAPFAAATDPIIGAKLAAAIFGGLAVLPAFALGARFGKNAGAGLISAALVATAAGGTYLAIEFVKNGIGMTLALTAVWLVLRATDSPSKPRLALAVLCVIAACATHKLAGAFTLACAAPAVVGALADRGKLRGRRLVYACIGVIALAVIALVSSGFLDDLFTTRMRLGAPALARGDRVLLAMGHEPLIGAVLAWIALVVLATHRGPTLSRPTQLVAWLVVGLSLALAFPWLSVEDPQGLAFRLRVIAFIPLALCAAIIAGAAKPLGRARLPVLAAIALLLVIAMPKHRVDGRIHAHPAMVAAVQAMSGDIPDGDVVIVPERHIMFMVAWYTRIAVRLSPDIVPHDRRWRAMPLAFIGTSSPLDQILVEARREPSIAHPIGLHPSHPNGFVLVREATWEWILEQLPPEARAHYAAWPTI